MEAAVAQFINASVVVTMLDPPDVKYSGRVVHIEMREFPRLFLQNVRNMQTGEWRHSLYLDSNKIKDVEMAADPPTRPTPPTLPTFADPAIVSVGKAPRAQVVSQQAPIQQAPVQQAPVQQAYPPKAPTQQGLQKAPQQVAYADALNGPRLLLPGRPAQTQAQPPAQVYSQPISRSTTQSTTFETRDAHLPSLSTAETEVPSGSQAAMPIPQQTTSTTTIPRGTVPKILTRNHVSGGKATHNTQPATSQMQPSTTYDHLGVAVVVQGAPSGPSKTENSSRRGNKGGQHKNVEEGPISSPATGNQQHGANGWRQTPILQSTSSFQPFDSLKKKSGKGRPTVDNGWMSEDVTGMGEFDFETNLAKFNKDSVFDQYRKEDQVKESDRLVSHNRTHVGPSGGQNIHHTEMVLDNQPAVLAKTLGAATNKDFWNSEAENGGLLNSDDRRQRETGSGRSSRRGDSKVSTTRRSQSRKASSQAAPSHPPSRVNSGVGISNMRPRLLRRGTNSHETMKDYSETSQERRATKKQPVVAATRGLYLVDSGKHVDTISPLQMLNLENIASNEIGLRDEMITENSARGIAEVALLALADPALNLRTADSSSPPNPAPATIVIMAGNNKSGTRAVAAGRHLRNKGVNTVLCVVGIERERNATGLVDDLREQIRIYRNFGGRVFSKSDLFEHLRKTAPPASNASSTGGVSLVIDALLGLAMSFEELRTSDQATTYELIQWANRNEAFVLAVDVPTGIDPSTGRVNNIEGDKLYIKPRYVAVLGVPKKGIVATLAEDGDAAKDLVGGADDWNLFLVDMGLGSAVWKKAGTKMRRGIDMGGKWVQEMKLRYQGMDDDDR